ncbi:MAG: RNA polymerase subunit sigma-70, partial [Clostridia bacterium]|nr:RNA polymerase subunit sigma-70 [Clostridia bacterium]
MEPAFLTALAYAVIRWLTVLTGYLNGGSTFPKPLSREEEARYLNEMRAG